jgi:hypothetical protein
MGAREFLELSGSHVPDHIESLFYSLRSFSHKPTIDFTRFRFQFRNALCIVSCQVLPCPFRWTTTTPQGTRRKLFRTCAAQQNVTSTYATDSRLATAAFLHGGVQKTFTYNHPNELIASSLGRDGFAGIEARLKRRSRDGCRAPKASRIH